MFKGVVRGVVAPFFGVTPRDEAGDAAPEEEEEEEGKGGWAVGQEKWGWRKVGQGQVRGPTV